MTELQKQWAVRLPDGSIWSRPASLLFANDSRRIPCVYDTEQAAQRALEDVRQSARELGVSNLIGVVVFRYLSEWSNSTSVSDADSLIASIEKHLEGGNS